jgi:hypothetical protein
VSTSGQEGGATCRPNQLSYSAQGDTATQCIIKTWQICGQMHGLQTAGLLLIIKQIEHLQIDTAI